MSNLYPEGIHVCKLMLTNGNTFNFKVDGAFLVSGCVNDLGEESERVSGYYPTQPDGSNRPWRWDLMKENARRIVHIGSLVARWP